jgi:large subunit ribosomal protein L30
MAKLNITQVRSRIGATKTQCKNLDALGLRRMGRTVQHEDSATIMGMIERVRHLVKVEAGVASKEEKPTKVKAAHVAETVVCEAPAETKGTAKKPAAPKTAKPAAEKKAAAPKAATAKKPAAKKTEE